MPSIGERVAYIAFAGGPPYDAIVTNVREGDLVDVEILIPGCGDKMARSRVPWIEDLLAALPGTATRRKP